MSEMREILSNVHASDDFITAHVFGDDGKLGGVIMLQNVGLNLAWGLRRDQWNWLVVGSELTVLGGSTGPYDALSGAVDAQTTGPAMLGSFLSYCAAQAEAASNPSSDNYNLFPKAIREWCVEFVSELAYLQMQLQGEPS